MLGKLFQNFGVQSRLIALVLTASLVSLLLTGLTSYGIAQHLLTEAGYQRLIALRNARAEAINEDAKRLYNQVLTWSEAPLVIGGTRAFTEGFNQLPDINSAQQKALANYYKTDFLAKLEQRSSSEPRLATYYPVRTAERYVKYHYLAANNGRDRKRLDDAKDGSAWSSSHAQYHSRFRRLANLFDYSDIMLVDIKTGNVVYSVAKEEDLGTNLIDGPLSDTLLAKVFQDIKKSKDPMYVTYTDLEHYKPSFGRPTQFVGTTVFDGNDFIGALIFQLDGGRWDRLLTSNRKWKEVGMGATGETYIVGTDQLFRSSPRPFLENSSAYLEVMKRNGLPQTTLAHIEADQTPVLIQTVKTRGTQQALEGRSGTAAYLDYRGTPVIGAYQPIRFGPYDWALLAEIDRVELFSGVNSLARRLLLLAAILIPLVTMATLAMARAFIKPIRRLLEATQMISSGNYNVQVPESTKDEFGELSNAFNVMSTKLQEREAAIKDQMAENERLLLSILPRGPAKRLKQGDAAIVDHHLNLTVMDAEIGGWNALTEGMPALQSTSLLNELLAAFDETAQSFGVESLHDLAPHYLAVSGFSLRRVDHEKTVVDCAIELSKVMQRFRRNHDLPHLTLDIGIHRGPLTAAVANRKRLAFDVWGETITLVRSLHHMPRRDGIQVTQPVKEALEGLYRFSPLTSVPWKGHGEITLWAVQSPQAQDNGDTPPDLAEMSS